MSLGSVLSVPWAFARPTTELRGSITDAAKLFLDPLASSISDVHYFRQRQSRKRKRAEIDWGSTEPLQLRQLYVDGFNPEQIWEQALRILDSVGREIEHDLSANARLAERSDAGRSSTYSNDPKVIDFSDEFSDDGNNGEKGVAISMDYDSAPSDLPQVEDHESDSEAISDETSHERDISGASDADESEHDTYTADPFGLNDGFFSIDEFNKQSEQFERQDARGGGNESESDDEEIDWHADPHSAGGLGRTPDQNRTRSKNDEDGSSDDDSDDGGLVFGSIDDQDGADEEDAAFANASEGINTSDIKYSDFFAPPPRKITSNKARPLPKTQPNEDINDNDISRAIGDVRRDLFEDEVSVNGREALDDETMDSHHQASSHEKQRAQIADEIRRLEAANVAKKEWMIAGEARAGERPVNSLIEEDLEYERIGKPMPVVTTQISEDIEELVKRRIIAKEFDEVIRRRPSVLGGHSAREKFEVEDTKPQQSLAEIYEAEHLRATDPNYIDPKNQKLLREHADISNLWKDVSSQLDTLSNWHYKPKAPQANINVITDVPTIMMEDAQPTASSAVGGPGALAPQEIYAPGNDGKFSGEFVSKSGVSVAKEELSREGRARLRRQHKKQKKAAPGKSGKITEREQIVTDLKKGGVRMIGKQGEVMDIDGKKAVQGARSGADSLKL